MAMLAAAAALDFPPMAIESLPSAFAGAVLLEPIAIAATPLALAPAPSAVA
jgi:hypothetical protein